MKVRKLLAGILSAAMVIGTMVVPISAATATELPAAVNGVITLTEDVVWTVNYNDKIANDVDLSGHTLTLTTGDDTFKKDGTGGTVGVSKNLTIKNGKLKIDEFNSTTGVINVTNNASLTLTDVEVKADKVSPGTGIFNSHDAEANKIILNNTNVTTSNLSDVRGVFYMGSIGCKGSVEINGGTFDINNNGDKDNSVGAYDDGGAMFYIIPAKLNGVTINSSCGRPMFRNVLNCEITDSKIEAAQVRASDAVFVTYPGSEIPAQTITFKKSEITTLEAAKLFEGNIYTDADTTYNSGKLSAVEGVTVKEADKLPDAVDGVIKLTENVTLKTKIGETTAPESGNIDLNGKTLTLTENAAFIVKNFSFKNGNIVIKDLNSNDGAFYIRTDSGTLTFDDVKITVNGMSKGQDGTGVFRSQDNNQKIILNNTDVTTSDLNDTYLFYGDAGRNTNSSVEINGGTITMKNDYTGTDKDVADDYSKGAFFYIAAYLNGVTLNLDCGRSCFRYVSDCNVVNSTLNVKQILADDAVVEGSNMTFINSKLNTNGGAVLTSGTSTIKSDSNTTYNNGKLSEADGVTAFDSTVAVLGLDTEIKLYKTLKEAIDAIAAAKPTNTVTIECVAGADVGVMTHGHVASDLIINGNGAHLTYGSGEGDLEFDSFNDTSKYLTRDVKVVVNDLNGIGAWGERHTDHKITLEFNNCKNMSKIIFSVGTGPVDVTLNNCSFDRDVNASTPKDTAVYIITKADVKINNTTFNNVATPVNMANKSNGEQKLSLDGCTFTNCATEANGTNAPGYAAPVRMTTRGTSTTTATIKDCTFTNCGGAGNGQILLGDGRDGKDSTAGVTVSVSGTAAEVQTQYPGEADKTAKETLTAADSKTITMKALKTVWETMTDSGVYGDNKGVIRFSFKVNPTKSFGAITKAGIKFVNTENTEINAETAVGVDKGGADSVFYADIKGITGNGKYFARAYISNGTSTEWSDMVEATVDWNRTFTAYAE